MTNYYNIKQQCSVKCEGAFVDTLIWFISSKYKKDNNAVKVFSLHALTASSDPVEYYQMLESEFKTNAHQRVAVTKGKH